MLYRSEEKGAEFAALRTDSFEVILFEEAREKRLHQIFGVFLVCRPA